MSYWLDRRVEKHLFDTDKRSDIVENTLEEQVEVQKLIFGDLEKGKQRVDLFKEYGISFIEELN